MANLKRISQVRPQELPFARTTLYKLKHLKRYPNMFVKLGRAVYVDLDEVNRVIEAGRVK